MVLTEKATNVEPMPAKGKKMKSTPQTARRTSKRISPEQPTSASKKKKIQVELVDVEKAKGGEEKDAVDEPVKEDEMVDTEAAKETADLSTPKDDGCESTEGAETAVEEGTKVAVEEGAEEAAPDKIVEDEDGAEKPAEETAEKAAEEPAEEPAKDGAEEPAKDGAEKPTEEKSTEDDAEKPAEDGAEKPADEEAEKPAEDKTEEEK